MFTLYFLSLHLRLFLLFLLLTFRSSTLVDRVVSFYRPDWIMFISFHYIIVSVLNLRIEYALKQQNVSIVNRTFSNSIRKMKCTQLHWIDGFCSASGMDEPHAVCWCYQTNRWTLPMDRNKKCNVLLPLHSHLQFSLGLSKPQKSIHSPFLLLQYNIISHWNDV